MSVDYSVNIMKGVFVTADEIYSIAKRFGIEDINHLDEDELYGIFSIISEHPKFELMRKHLSIHTINGENSRDGLDGIIVAQKSSFINNDAKRGDGKLFEKVIISGHDLVDLESERNTLEEFRTKFNIAGKVDTIIVGLVH